MFSDSDHEEYSKKVREIFDKAIQNEDVNHSNYLIEFINVFYLKNPKNDYKNNLPTNFRKIIECNHELNKFVYENIGVEMFTPVNN